MGDGETRGEKQKSGVRSQKTEDGKPQFQHSTFNHAAGGSAVADSQHWTGEGEIADTLQPRSFTTEREYNQQ